MCRVEIQELATRFTALELEHGNPVDVFFGIHHDQGRAHVHDLRRDHFVQTGLASARCAGDEGMPRQRCERDADFLFFFDADAVNPRRSNVAVHHRFGVFRQDAVQGGLLDPVELRAFFLGLVFQLLHGFAHKPWQIRQLIGVAIENLVGHFGVAL